jgi:cardiolipin synthase
VGSIMRPEPKNDHQNATVVVSLLNLPNMITLCRIAIVPVFLIFVSRRDFASARYMVALAALSDGLDGAIARWCNSKSELGAFLDPFADKLLLVSSFTILTAEGLLPVWLLAVVFGRDGFIVCGYFLLIRISKQRIEVSPNFLGKTGTVLQLACVMGALLPIPSAGFWRRFWDALLWTTAAATGLSGLIYTYGGLLFFRSHRAAPQTCRT